MSRTKNAGSVSGAVLAGVLLVPATAIAAVAIVGATSRPPSAEASVDESTTTVLSQESTTSTPDDAGLVVDEACSQGAEGLLAKEAADTLTDLEAAALDALRDVCDEHGMPIAGPPAPEPIVRTVTVSDGSGAQPGTQSDDRYEDEYEDHDEDEYEDHEDEHDEDHEDEDHEDEHDEEDDD